MRTFYQLLILVSISLAGGCWSQTEVHRSETNPKGDTSYQNITGGDSDENKERWNSIYNTSQYVFGREPSRFLKRYIHLLPKGKALDVAMSEGRNAVFLAKKGFHVIGVDYSEKAIRKAKLLAKENKVSIETEIADLTQYQIPENQFEAIVVVHYLQRSLIPKIKKGLKKGGVVLFENYTLEHLKNPKGAQMPSDWLLRPGELRELFSDFEILAYHESNDGKEAVAQVVAKKP